MTPLEPPNKWTLFFSPLSGRRAPTSPGHKTDRMFAFFFLKRCYYTQYHSPVFVVAVVCFRSFVTGPQWGTVDTLENLEPSRRSLLNIHELSGWLCSVLGSPEHSLVNWRTCMLPTHHHQHLFLKREGRWGTTDDFATSFLHLSLFSAALWDLPNSRPVHSLMLSSHLPT